MSRIFSLASAICCLVWFQPSGAVAQVGEELNFEVDRRAQFDAAVRRLTFEGQPAVAGFGWRERYDGGDHAVLFYRRFGESGTTSVPEAEWTARHVKVSQDDMLTERWIQSEDCPALLTTIAAMNELPRLGVGHSTPGPGSPPLNPSIDGATFSVWSREVAQGHDRATVMMISAVGPVAEFARSANHQLDPCWIDQKPGRREPG